MGRIWAVMILGSAGLSLISGRAGESAGAVIASGTQAISLLTTLLATMTLWSGLLEIISVTGDVDKLGRLFRRMLTPLFPGLSDETAWNAMSMNLAANLLGLGNAATPAGIEAAKRLSTLGDCGMRALAMLLVLDNASLQLIPTTVITLRQAAGARDPADIWGMTLIVSAAATVLSVAMMKMLGGCRDERINRNSHRRAGRLDCAARPDDGT